MAGTKDEALQPKGFQQLVGDTAAHNLTVPAGARYAMFNVSGTTATAFRDDGTDPSTTVGMILTPGTNYWYTGKLAVVRVIAAATSSLNVSYYA